MPSDRLVTPVGPMVIQQKSNGDYLFSTAVVYQNLLQVPPSTESVSVTCPDDFSCFFCVCVLCVCALLIYVLFICFFELKSRM